MPPKRTNKHKTKQSKKKKLTNRVTTVLCSYCDETVPEANAINCEICAAPCCKTCTSNDDGTICNDCNYIAECECDDHSYMGFEDLNDEAKRIEIECTSCEKTCCLACISHCDDCGKSEVCMDCTRYCKYFESFRCGFEPPRYRDILVEGFPALQSVLVYHMLNVFIFSFFFHRSIRTTLTAFLRLFYTR